MQNGNELRSYFWENVLIKSVCLSLAVSVFILFLHQSRNECEQRRFNISVETTWIHSTIYAATG